MAAPAEARLLQHTSENPGAAAPTPALCKASQMSTRCSWERTRPPHRQTCRVTGAGPAHGPGAGLSPRGAEVLGSLGWGSAAEPLSAEAHGQAVPRVRVFFPPPAGAVILVVPPVAHGGPHTSAAHRAVAAALRVAVRAFHGELHAIVLLMVQMRAGQRGGGCRGDGRGRRVVDALQRGSPFDASLPARNSGHPKGRRRDGEPGLIVGGHDQCSGRRGLRFATGHRQGSR